MWNALPKALNLIALYKQDNGETSKWKEDAATSLKNMPLPLRCVVIVMILEHYFFIRVIPRPGGEPTKVKCNYICKIATH